MSVAPGPRMLIYTGYHTDVGKVRERNEDALLQSPVPLGHLAAVADGMGGHQLGDKAAALTLEAIADAVSKEQSDPVRALRAGFEAANRQLREEGAQLGVTMGATGVAVLIASSKLYVAHVGDARAYLLRGASLFTLTRDHSLMQELADIKGPVAATEFAPALRHIMSRSVGAEDDINVAVRDPIHLSAGDVVLLCTDGLTGAVDDGRIRRTLAGATPREAARRLIEMANEGGGEDNVTAIVLRVDTDLGEQEGRALSFDDLTSMFVRTADGDLHPIVDAVISPSTWAVAAIRLDLRNAERGALCELPVSEVGPIASGKQTIVSPQRTEALLDLARVKGEP